MKLARLRQAHWFALLVGVPVMFTAVYEGFIASDVYVSESRFVIKAPGQRSAQVSSLANLVQTTGLSAGQEQANEVMDYIRSRTALVDLDKGGSVEALFTHPDADFLSRYPMPFSGKSRESLFRYYLDMISVGLDHETGLVVLRVKGYAPKDAEGLNQRLLVLSENLVNALNERARDKQVNEAERRVALAQQRVVKARSVLAGFRNDRALLDPAKQATGVLEVANRLVGERATLQAQLTQMETQTPRNPAIPALRAKVAAMAQAEAGQTARAVGTSNGIASKLPNYEALYQEQEFAAQNLNAASAALEAARSDATRQQYYLERVVEPAVPDEAVLPHRLKIILTVLGASLCLYFVGWMFLVGILEHAPED